MIFNGNNLNDFYKYAHVLITEFRNVCAKSQKCKETKLVLFLYYFGTFLH